MIKEEEEYKLRHNEINLWKKYIQHRLTKKQYCIQNLTDGWDLLFWTELIRSEVIKTSSNKEVTPK